MKLTRLIAAAMFAAVLTTTAVASNGGPWAGVVRVSTTSAPIGLGLTITYHLSLDADSVTIDILDSSDAVVATFAGTATEGLNTVAWDGTDTNAGGTILPLGTGYKVRVTVDNSVAAAWTRVIHRISNNSTGTEPTATFPYFFSPQGYITMPDQGSDLFGIGLFRTSSLTTNAHSGSIEIYPNLTPLKNIVGINEANALTPFLVNNSLPTASGAMWGASRIPGTDNSIIYAGQTGGTDIVNDYRLAENTFNSYDATAPNVGITGMGVSPRSIIVKDEGGSLWAYACPLANNIRKSPLDATGLPTGAGFLILDATTLGTRYSLAVTLDNDGNLYWVSRTAAGGDPSTLYRFPASKIDAITADTDPKLVAADADWTVTIDAGIPGFAITPIFKEGICYLPAGSANGNSADFAVYTVGATNTVVGAKLLASGDALLNVPGGNDVNGLYGPVNFDPFGNIVTANRSPETASLFSPGGTTSNVTVAPASQTFNITDAPTSAGPSWLMYE